MRVVDASGYVEPRDALAQDWGRFLAQALPNHMWMPLPNVRGTVLDIVRGWQLDGFILSGGNDLGDAPERDETERALLAHAASTGRPVLGVCRGLQVIQDFYDGPLSDCEREEHVATRHEIEVNKNGPALGAKAGTHTVNSFHAKGIERLASPLAPFATARTTWIEGAFHPDTPLVGIMWHPEREPQPTALDRALMTHLFGADH